MYISPSKTKSDDYIYRKKLCKTTFFYNIFQDQSMYIKKLFY